MCVTVYVCVWAVCFSKVTQVSYVFSYSVLILICDPVAGWQTAPWPARLRPNFAFTVCACVCVWWWWGGGEGAEERGAEERGQYAP